MAPYRTLRDANRRIAELEERVKELETQKEDLIDRLEASIAAAQWRTE